MRKYINCEYLTEESSRKLRERYNNATPFKHLTLDDFLIDEAALALLSNFPSRGTHGSREFNVGYRGEKKYQVSPEAFDCPQIDFFRYLNSAPFLRLLENITGIDGLIGDPHFLGGGYHCTSRGGRLGVHADFSINPELNLYRRLNLIIYLNKDWQSDFDGDLELWDSSLDRCVVAVSPTYNRAVIFSTDPHCYHGHPRPLRCPENTPRRSIALYYYTAQPSLGMANDLVSDTLYYAPRGFSLQERIAAVYSRVRVSIKKTLNRR